MGREARLNRQLGTLPVDQWECIWCDGRPPDVTFNRREHVMPESLGGEREFRLKRGIVCDRCNGGVLKQIDDELNLNPLIRFLRFQFGLGPRFRELRSGVRKDGDVITLTPNLIGPRDKLSMELVPGGGGTFTLTTSGPSDKARAEHLARGLHRMAYNAIAHADGPSRARREFLHLRSYVLAPIEEGMRAYLLDEKTLEAGLRSPGPWKADYELIRDAEGRPQIALLRLGLMFFYVSLEPTTRPLHAMRARFPWLRVAGAIDS